MPKMQTRHEELYYLQNQGQGDWMNMDEIKRVFDERYTNWNVYFEQSGIATWISMNDGNHFFEIQIAPNMGVGVTDRRNVSEIDFSGHDVAFDSLNEALEYVDKIVDEL